MNCRLKGSLILLLWTASPAWADGPPAAEEAAAPKAVRTLVTQTAVSPPAPAAAKQETVSAAEQVVNLRRAIDAGQEHLDDLKAVRDDPNSECAQAETAFEQADAALEAQKQALKQVPEDDKAGREAARAELARLEKARSLAKDRFDLAIEDRKVAAEQVLNLEQNLLRDRKTLAKLEGNEPPEEPAVAPTQTSTPIPGNPATPAPVVAPAASPETTPAATPDATASAAPAVPGVPGTPAAAVAAPATAAEEGPPSKELVKATEDARAKAAAAKEADAEAQSVTERLEGLDREIAVEQKLLATGRKQRDNATEILRSLNETFRRRSLAGAPRAELDDLLAQVHKIEERHKAAGDDALEHSTRLEELQTERAVLHTEELDALRKANEAHAEVKVAETEIKRLENPFSPHNVLRWLVDHGPRLLTILLAILIGHWFSKLFSQRVIRLLAHHGARGSSVEREDRARTLVGVFHNAASMAIVVGGGLMILQESGVPIAPLLGGAAVFGLAVAFGAQNLIRDYFYGFVILLENQYKLNDVVQIGERSGQVEKITLRMTVLRDLEGRVHFLPNGEITAVTNMTHGWSRALFSINVGYGEDVDHVMAVLSSLAADMRNDPVFGPMILEDATMLGVDEIGESSIVIKFFIKTRPIQQWNVKRELLRRIKLRFDELNIELPFPHRIVYHRVEPGVTLPPALSTPSRVLHGAHAPHASSRTDGPAVRD